MRTWKTSATGSRIVSQERRSGFIKIAEPKKPVITIKGDKKSTDIKDSRTTASEETVSFSIPTYADTEITFEVSADQEFTGSWTLDDKDTQGNAGTIDKASKKVSISLKDLTQGSHILKVRGQNAAGDSFEESYAFGVDTCAPRLLLSTPLSGTIYDNGTLIVEGVTDADALLTVKDKTMGVTLATKQAVSVDNEGRFHVEFAMQDTKASHEMVIQAEDALGNKATRQASVLSGRLGQISGLALYADGVDVTGQKIANGAVTNLQLMARTMDGSLLEINDPSLVDWQETVMEGSATVESGQNEAKLQTSKDAIGMISARYLVNDAGAYTVSAYFAAADSSDDNDPDNSNTDKDNKSGDASGNETNKITDASGTVQSGSESAKAKNSGAKGKDAKSAKTGDTANLIWPVCALLVSGTAGIIAVMKKKKKEQEAEEEKS